MNSSTRKPPALPRYRMATASPARLFTARKRAQAHVQAVYGLVELTHEVKALLDRGDVEAASIRACDAMTMYEALREDMQTIRDMAKLRVRLAEETP